MSVNKTGKHAAPDAKGVVLKPGKDKPVRNRHHWIFSGAVARLPFSRTGISFLF